VRRTWLPYAALVVGVLTVSWAAILIRLAEAPSLVVAAGRLLLASLVLTPMAAVRNGTEIRRLRVEDWGMLLLSGALLGLHFAAWIGSLTYTSVASSVVLVATSPVFVGLAARFLLHEQVSLRMATGILVATLGGLLIGWGDFRISGRALWGDLLAVVGAVAVSGYFLLGTRLRRRLSLLAYITPTYWAAALFLTLAMWLSGGGLGGYPPMTYLMLLLLALGPQVLGHSSFNWALRYLSPTLVTVSILGEPIGSTVLAYLVLQEVPSALKVFGGAVILLGIYVCSRAETSGGVD